jgi:hypothetical protein
MKDSTARQPANLPDKGNFQPLPQEVFFPYDSVAVRIPTRL